MKGLELAKVPNQKLTETAAREEILLLSLILKNQSLMADAARCLTPQCFQNGIPRRIYEMALRHHDAYGQLMTRPAMESVLAATTTAEDAAFLQSQYDSVFAEFIKANEYGMLKDNVQARHMQRQAYAACQSFAERLLTATTGQKELVEEFRAATARITTYASDDGFEEYTLSSLEAYEPNPNDNIAGDGWIRRGGACLMTGSTGVGKSVLVSQLAVCLAAGVPFMGIEVKSPVRVLYVQSENDAGTLKRDVCSIAVNVEPTPGRATVDANLKIVHAFGKSGKAFHPWLEWKATQHKADVVIIDHYQAYIDGGDINSSELALEWIRPIDAMAKSAGMGLVIVCHTTKPQDRKNWAARDSVYMAAGSSVVANWTRTSCELTTNGEDGRYRLRFGKNAERTGVVDGDGHIVRDLYVEHSGDRTKPYWQLSALQMPTDGEYDGAIINLYNGDPSLSLREIATRAGCSKSHVSNVLAKFKEHRPQDRPPTIKKGHASSSPRLSSPPQGGWTGGQTGTEGVHWTASGQSGQQAGQSGDSTGATPSDDFLAEPIDALGGAEGGVR